MFVTIELKTGARVTFGLQTSYENSVGIPTLMLDADQVDPRRYLFEPLGVGPLGLARRSFLL